MSLIALGLMLLKIPVVMNAVGPVIFGDELLYREAAEAFWRSSGDPSPFLAAAPTHYPPLYSLVLAPAFAVRDFYAAMLVINVVISSLVPLGMWLIARELVPRRLALFAAAITALLPYHVVYPQRVMSENLFLPVFLFAVYATIQVLRRRTWPRVIAVGAAASALVLTRHAGLVMIPVFLVAVAYRRGSSTDTVGRWLGLLAASSVAMAVYLPWLLHGLARTTFSETIGLGATPGEPSGLASLGEWLAVYGAYAVALAGPALPLLLMLRRAWPALTSFQREALYLVGALTVTSFAATIRHSWYVYPDFGRIHGRYVLHLLPLWIIVALLVLTVSRRLGPEPSRAVPAACLVSAGFVVLAWQALDLRDAMTHVNSVDGYALSTPGTVLVLALGLVAAALVVSGARRWSTGSVLTVATGGLLVGYFAYASTATFVDVNLVQAENHRAIHVREVADTVRSVARADREIEVRYRLPGVRPNALRQGLRFWEVPTEHLRVERLDDATGIDPGAIVLEFAAADTLPPGGLVLHEYEHGGRVYVLRRIS